MDDDLRTGLLNRKAGFDKFYEDCMTRIQRVRQKNDVIQRQIGTDVEQSIRQEVGNQKKFIEKEIMELKDLLNQMERKYRDPESKTKIKQLKNDAHKQIERNKIILKDLINKSFAARSMRAHHQTEPEQNLMQGGKIDYQNLERDKIPEEEEEYKSSMMTDQAVMEVDYEIERKILLEKNEMINDVEQSTIRINQIMNDMAVMVDEQGQNLDIISEELIKTNTNLVHTNKNLDQASTLQKKSRKKYVILVVIIVLVIVVLAGVVYFLTT